MIRTFLADGVMFPGNIIIPLLILFSSKMPISLCAHMLENNKAVRLDDVLSHGFHTDALLVRKEHKYMIGIV